MSPFLALYVIAGCALSGIAGFAIGLHVSHRNAMRAMRGRT